MQLVQPVHVVPTHAQDAINATATLNSENANTRTNVLYALCKTEDDPRSNRN